MRFKPRNKYCEEYRSTLELQSNVKIYEKNNSYAECEVTCNEGKGAMEA